MGRGGVVPLDLAAQLSTLLSPRRGLSQRALLQTHPPRPQYRQEFEDIENQEYAKSLKERRKRMEKMQSAGDMSGMEEL